jgi:hypothetical protein
MVLFGVYIILQTIFEQILYPYLGDFIFSRIHVIMWTKTLAFTYAILIIYYYIIAKYFFRSQILDGKKTRFADSTLGSLFRIFFGTNAL